MVDASDSGGFPGRCSPPNRRIAELYRLVLAETKARSEYLIYLKIISLTRNELSKTRDEQSYRYNSDSNYYCFARGRSIGKIIGL